MKCYRKEQNGRKWRRVKPRMKLERKRVGSNGTEVTGEI